MILTGEKPVPMPLSPPLISSGLQRRPEHHPCYKIKVYFQLQTQLLLHIKHAASLLQGFLSY